jgi:uncharacterized Zn finger protein (UPF0148 family)
MTEPVANFTIQCPQCGATLQIEHEESVSQVQPENRVLCPVHGDLGSYAEFEPAVKEAVAKKAKSLIEEMFQRAVKG